MVLDVPRPFQDPFPYHLGQACKEFHGRLTSRLKTTYAPWNVSTDVK